MAFALAWALLLGCGTSSRQRIAAQSDEAARNLLQEGRAVSLSLPPDRRDPDIARIVERFAAPPRSLAREALLRTGPELWMARYRFTDLRLFDPEDGRPRLVTGTLELELRVPHRGPTVVRQAVVEADGLPPAPPYPPAGKPLEAGRSQ